MARWKLGASTIIEILPLSTCTLCQQKSYISKGIQSIFEIFASAAIWVGSFRCAGVLLLQWQSENFAHRQHFKFCHFQPVHCASRNPISPKIFNQFSKSSPQLEDSEVGHLGGKFQVRRYFNFAMARWKLGASTTFEILPRSSCTLCQQKSFISKGIQSNFEIFASARRCWRCPFGWKASCAQVFCFCNGKVKTWRIDNNWNFATFKLYTVPAKILYLQRYSRDFRNLRLISKMWTVAIWLKSFRCARILLLQWQGERLCIEQIWHFATFNLYTVPAKIIYLQRYSIDFRNLCLSSKMLTMAHFGGKFHVRSYYTFAMARWKLGASTTFEIFSRSSCTLCQQKSYISKGIQSIFEIFAPARRCWQWPFGWKVSGAQVFYFCNGKVKTLRIDNILNFATFNLQLCKQKSYISKDIQPIFEIFARRCWLSSKMLRLGIWVESFRCAGILILQWQGENLAHRQHLKFCHVQPVHCASKNPISPKVFNRISKSLPQLEDVDDAHLGEKFHVRRYFAFAMARWRLGASTIIEILPLSTCTRCEQKSFISKGVQPILEIFAPARRCWQWPFGWNVSGAQVFYFCNGKVKTFRIDNILNFATFNLYTVPAKILYLQRYSTNFRNLSLSSKMLRVGIWVGSFSFAGILLLKWLVKVSASITFEILLLSTGTLCHNKSYISEDIQPIFENFASARRFWGWAFGWEVSAAQVFYFCNGKVKLCASTTSEILLLSTCTLCQQKSYISKDIQPIFEIFASARRCWGWALGWKVSGAQVFCFCNSKVKTWRIDNIWNFATFKLYTVPAKILYLQRYSTDFWNLSLSSKMLTVAIWVKSFSCAGILLLQWLGENLAHRQHLKFCHVQHVH